MKQFTFSLITAALCFHLNTYAQYVGINTNDPQRTLDVQGADDQSIRVQTTVGTESGIELINGTGGGAARDWKIANTTGTFSILTGTNNFSTSGETVFRINSSGNVGLRSVVSDSKFHVNAGEEASNAQHGYMVIGSTTGYNIVADQNEINARNNGIATTFYLQEEGGNTFIGQNDGDTFFGTGGGNVGIRTTYTPRKLSIESTNEFQMYIRNSHEGVNDWFIGASNPSWVAGGNQLLFSPESSSSSSIFRLMDIADNDGEHAPVIIESDFNQALLLDGNEIDSREGPLYINHNSDQNTLINPSGGSAGVGTMDPFSTFHIVTPGTEYALRLENGSNHWSLHPYNVSNKLSFIKNDIEKANVNGTSGQWNALSDRTMKKDIEPLQDVLKKVRAMGLYTYNFVQDTEKKLQYGVLAQEMESLFPEVVNVSDTGYSVSYGQLGVIALKALQEQQKEIDILQAELNQLLSLNTNH
jgi:hypothetical protein